MFKNTRARKVRKSAAAQSPAFSPHPGAGIVSQFRIHSRNDDGTAQNDDGNGGAACMNGASAANDVGTFGPTLK